MQKVVCVDASNSNTLEQGVTYYAFPHTAGAYYVSKFPREGASFGAFQRDRFEVLEQIVKMEILPPDPEENFEQLALF